MNRRHPGTLAARFSVSLSSCVSGVRKGSWWIPWEGRAQLVGPSGQGLGGSYPLDPLGGHCEVLACVRCVAAQLGCGLGLSHLPPVYSACRGVSGVMD